jgi:hypothetical protein
MIERRPFGRRPAALHGIAVERDGFALLDAVGLGSAMRFSLAALAVVATIAWLAR